MTPTSPTPESDAPPEAGTARASLVDRAVATWTSQLIDLGARNSLLYYRDLRAGTLELTGADRQTVEQLLSGKPVRLSKLFPETEAFAAAVSRARRIRSKTKEHKEERGLDTLYVGQGLATWTTTTTTATPAAPILLHPVRIKASGMAEDDFELVVDGDPTVNPVLVHLFATDFGLKLDTDAVVEPRAVDAVTPLSTTTSTTAAAPTDPTDPGAPTDPVTAAPAVAPVLAVGAAPSVSSVFEPPAFVNLLDACTATIPGFSLSTRIVLGNFSYAKLPMVVDLQRSLAALRAHDIVAAIAGATDARDSVRQRASNVDIPADAPDRAAPAEEFLVLDADASQHQAINRVVAGSDLIVKGPPGTGKSQTISNLIAALVASGKSVLFVAEKRAAIDAVVKRLARVGLGEVVLDLHDGLGSRKRLAQDLARMIEATESTPLPDTGALDLMLSSRRDELRTRDTAIHEPRNPWGVTVYELQARLMATPAPARTELRFRGDALTRLDSTTMSAAAGDLRTWVGLAGPGVVQTTAGWGAALGVVRTPADAETASAEAAEASTTFGAFDAMLDRACAQTGIPAPETVGQATTITQLLIDVCETEQRFGAAVWTHDLAALARAMEPARRGLVGRALATLFDGSWRTARKTVRALDTTGGTDENRRAVAEVAGAVQGAWPATAIDGGPPRRPSDPAMFVGAAGRDRDASAALARWFPAFDLGSWTRARRRAWAAELVADQPGLARLPELHRAREALVGLGLTALLETLSPGVDPERAQAMLDHAWLASILDHVVLTDPRIGAFDGPLHDRTVTEFADADRRHLDASVALVRRRVAEHSVEARDRHRDQNQLVERQAALSRRHLPMRDLFAAAPDVLTKLKPCWAMSPLVVSQLLPGDRPYFDVVVFDEASQIMPADAIPAILRGRQLMVAGDDRQLPPTAFFTVRADDPDDAGDGTGTGDSGNGGGGDQSLTEGFESILDALWPLLAQSPLRWHYRSRDERLIAFSNAFIYEGSLVTFPGVTGPECLAHVLVPFDAALSGETDADTGQGTTRAEVDTVVRLVIDHATNRPGESLGVIAFGITHAQRLEDALREVLRDRPDLADFFDEDGPGSTGEPFFVKNLERVQGDERDAIILSVGYAKAADGRLLYRFGPLLTKGGERRLNVAVTRAKRRMTVVSAFTGGELDLSRSPAEGVRLLKAFLEYMEHRGERGAATTGSSTTQAGSYRPDGLVAAIAESLRTHGIPVSTGYGVSGHRVDVAAMHPTDPKRAVMAIEVDGPSHAAVATVRDRHRLRQAQMERLGWSFRRVWTRQWMRHPDTEIAAIVEQWRAAVDRIDAPPSPPVAAPAPASPAAVNPAVVDPVIEDASVVDPRRGPRPRVPKGRPIGEYPQAHLVALVHWIESDTLLRTEDALVQDMIDALGFSRRGSRIEAAIRSAITESRR